jgi:hypothetical protein
MSRFFEGVVVEPKTGVELVDSAIAALGEGALRFVFQSETQVPRTEPTAVELKNIQLDFNVPDHYAVISGIVTQPPEFFSAVVRVGLNDEEPATATCVTH